jgi:hypothetical protein
MDTRSVFGHSQGITFKFDTYTAGGVFGGTTVVLDGFGSAFEASAFSPL